jgi:hypothetical protein
MSVSDLKGFIWGTARVLVAVSVLSAVSSLTAQTFRGAINGSVRDASGASIAAATLSARQEATAVLRSTASSSAGDFSFPDLPLGVYTVTATKAGFSEAKSTQVEVSVSTVTTLNLTLTVASQAVTVDVRGEAPQVETTSPRSPASSVNRP